MSDTNISGKTKAELLVIAKEMKIRSPAYLDKESLITAIREKCAEPETSQQESRSILCIHGGNLKECPVCVKRRFCAHGRYKYSCRSCGGTRFCKHGKIFRGCQSCFEALERFKQSLRLKPTD